MEINIDKYLSEDDKMEIAKDVFRGKIFEILCNEREITRIASNAAYRIIQSEVDKVIPEFLDTIKKSVIQQANKKDLSYYVFRDGQYGNKSLGYEILEYAVRESEEKIKDNIAKAIDNYDYSSLVCETMVSGAEKFLGSIYDIADAAKKAKEGNNGN